MFKIGVDNVGLFSQTGCVAGDEETYEMFSELFDRVIEEKHGYTSSETHASDYDGEKLVGGEFDSEYVQNIRLRVIRNLKGYCLPSFCTRGERRDIESVLVKALYALDSQFKGTYYSLKELNPEEQITLAKVTLNIIKKDLLFIFLYNKILVLGLDGSSIFAIGGIL